MIDYDLMQCLRWLFVWAPLLSFPFVILTYLWTGGRP